jgi:histidine triad (HIT) family protein
MGFHDLRPVAPMHVLVIPRRHIPDAASLGPDDGPLLGEMFAAARQVAAEEGYAERGYRLVFNVGPDSGSEVAHLHLHVIGGRPLSWPPG